MGGVVVRRGEIGCVVSLPEGGESFAVAESRSIVRPRPVFEVEVIVSVLNLVRDSVMLRRCRSRSMCDERSPVISPRRIR